MLELAILTALVFLQQSARRCLRLRNRFVKSKAGAQALLKLP